MAPKVATFRGQARKYASADDPELKEQETQSAPATAEHDSAPRALQPNTEGDSQSVILDLLAFLLGLVVVAMLFQMHASDPYMDEVFHIPQTQQYCQGHFWEWNPKITTFPGLYVFGAAGGRVLHAAAAVLAPKSRLAQDLCSTGVLRAVNIAFAAACFLLAHAIVRKLHPQLSAEYATHMALLVVLLPTNFFYQFLYYTDMGSLAWVLAALLASLHGWHHLSALAAAVAVLFRQTNAVWAAFVLLVALLQRFFGDKLWQMKEAGLEKQLVATLRLCWQERWRLISELWSLALVSAAFAAFVLWNGGIVVGDRSNHTPKLHLVQPLYFVLFTCGALAQIHFHPARLVEAAQRLRLAFQSSPGKVLRPLISAFVLTGYVVHHYTLAHPFLLSDNRHYTFYLWKDVIAPYPAARYCLVPLYLYSGWSIWDSLQQGRQLALWSSALAVCTAATLVPAWLLEFRYFTIPFVLVVLHMKPPSQGQLLQTIALFALVNAATIYFFLFRPFRWPDGSIARFMW